MDGMNQTEHQNNPGGWQNIYYQGQKNSFFTAAMFLGICSLLSLCTFFLPLPLGALGLLFICLGKRRGQKLTGTALTGLVTSLIGAVSGLIITVFTFVSAFTLLKPENRDVLNQQFEQLYGIDFEEYIEQLYGEDYLEQFDSMYQ